MLLRSASGSDKPMRRKPDPRRCSNRLIAISGWAKLGQHARPLIKHQPPHRHRAARPAAADPFRKYWAAHLSLPAQSFRRSAHGARAPARSGAPWWRGRPAHLLVEESERRTRRVQEARRHPACAGRSRIIRRGSPPSTTRLPCSPCAARATALTRPMIAIVGSRNASGAGLKFAERTGARSRRRRLRRRSPGSRAASTRPRTAPALKAARSRCWPAATTGSIRPSMRTSWPRLLAQGAAISEMPLGHVPRAHDFPRRNRLISGASLGVVIVEAAHRSGSLITARMAAEQGREVFAVPGSPLDPRAAGTNDLIKQGATWSPKLPTSSTRCSRSWNGRSCSRRAKTTTSRSISTSIRASTRASSPCSGRARSASTT